MRKEEAREKQGEWRRKRKENNDTNSGNVCHCQLPTKL